MATTPAEGGGFASRDESYVAGTGDTGPEPSGQLVWDRPSQAAEGTEVTSSGILEPDPVVHLLRRTTFGPTPDLVDEVRASGIDAWLDGQLAPETIADPTGDQVRTLYPLAGAASGEIQAQVERQQWDAMLEHGHSTLGLQMWSERQLLEVMVDFWANHLNVPVPGGAMAWDVGPSYQQDVIRAHSLGSFTDMLVAAMRHPAMLRYLTNAESTKDSVNENLGRELLELHTVGVGSGYTEDDVRNSAYILTGRTVARENDSQPWGTFVYDPGMHWTGEVKVLDFEHANASAEDGLEVGDAYLRYLAAHPSTAHTIARKLAVRFVSDDPSEDLVDRLAAQYQESDTQIVPVLDLLFRSQELWASVGHKTRRPLENLVASARILGVGPSDNPRAALAEVYGTSRRMGQRPTAWPSPDGYPDVHRPWRSVSGLLETWRNHRAFSLGWVEGFTYLPADELVTGEPPATIGEYVDRLCKRLCFQTFRPEHRQVLLEFLDVADDDPVAAADLDQMAGHLAALVLDAPYFALR